MAQGLWWYCFFLHVAFLVNRARVDGSRADDVDTLLAEEAAQQVHSAGKAAHDVRSHAALDAVDAASHQVAEQNQHDHAHGHGDKHEVNAHEDFSISRGGGSAKITEHGVERTRGAEEGDEYNVCVLGGGDKAFEKITEPLGKYIAEQGWNLVTGNINRGVVPSVRKAFKAAKPKGKSIQYYDPKGKHKDEENADEFQEQDPDDGAKKLEICAVVIALPGGKGVIKEMKSAKRMKLPIGVFLTDKDTIKIENEGDGWEKEVEVLANAVVKEGAESEDLKGCPIFMENEFDKVKEFLTSSLNQTPSSQGSADGTPADAGFDVCVLGGGTKPYEKISEPLGKFIAEQGWNLVTGNINAGPVARVRKTFAGAKPKGKSIQYYAKQDNFKDEEFATEFVEQEPNDGAAKIKICEAVVALPGGPGVASEIEAAKAQKVPVAAFLTEKEMIKVKDKDENANKKVKDKMEELGLKDTIFMEDEFSKVQDFLKGGQKSKSGANTNVGLSLTLSLAVLGRVFLSIAF